MQTNDIIFLDQEHRALFNEICSTMSSRAALDEYHLAAAYLMSLDTVCRKHTSDIFDFEEDCIKAGGLFKEWQTGTSTKTTRLIFNLWNGYTSEDEARDYTPESIFACSYAPYYWQAIKLRYPCYAEP